MMKVPSQSRKCCGRRCCCSLGWCCQENNCCRRICRVICICLGRKKRCLKRNSRFLKDMCMLYMITFLVAVPLLTLNLRHTALDFLKHRNVTRENERMIKENTERYNSSLDILRKFEVQRSSNNLNILRNILEQTPLSATHRPFVQDVRPSVQTGIAISVITVSRFMDDQEPRYLTQIVAAFLRLMNENEQFLKKYSVHFSICNVDAKPTRHVEVKELPNWIPVYTRYQNTSNKTESFDYKPILTKERDDYAYCLNRTLERNLSHVLLVEDDALPRDELFLVMDTLVFSGAMRRKHNQGNVTYYKLYHPERLLGYISLESERIPELLSLSAILSVILWCIYTRWRSNICTPHFLILLSLFIYSCVLFLAIGRVNIMECRRFSRYLYQLTPSPSCCTPAMLFTREGARNITNYFKTVIDRRRYAKDAAIDDYIRTNRLVTRFIQPNLFKHIGHVSSLRLKLLDPYIV